MILTIGFTPFCGTLGGGAPKISEWIADSAKGFMSCKLNEIPWQNSSHPSSGKKEKNNYKNLLSLIQIYEHILLFDFSHIKAILYYIFYWSFFSRFHLDGVSNCTFLSLWFVSYTDFQKNQNLIYNFLRKKS